MLYLYQRKIQRQTTHLRICVCMRASQGMLLFNLIKSNQQPINNTNVREKEQFPDFKDLASLQIAGCDWGRISRTSLIGKTTSNQKKLFASKTEKY